MEVNEFIRQLFDRAKAYGFTAAEAHYSTGEEFTVGVQAGQIIDYSVSSSQGLTFRGLVNGRMGYASTQVLDEDAIGLLVDGAGENASLIENDDEPFIFAGSESYPELDVYSEAVEALTAQQKIDMAKNLEKACLAIDERVKKCEMVEVVSMASQTRIVNTMGLDVCHRDNALGAFAAVIAQDGDDVTTGSCMAFVRDPAKLNIEEEAAKAVKDAVSGLHADKADSGAYKVVLRNDVAGSILRTFAGVFSADAAQKGLSLLKGREGEIIAAPCVDLIDDPLDPASPGATPFDGEGVATRCMALVTGGRLNTLMHNLRTAKKQGVSTTGHAAGAGHVGPHGLYIKQGGASFGDLIAEAQNGVFITDVQGLHSGANQISGDFSLGARGYIIENGQIGRPVSQITVAGNFFELLNNISAVADDLEFGFSPIASPSLLISSLSVAGK